MVHNSNFSSSENNNERVSWEQGKSWEASVIFPSVFFAYIKTKRTIIAVGGHLRTVHISSAERMRISPCQKKSNLTSFFFLRFCVGFRARTNALAELSK